MEKIEEGRITLDEHRELSHYLRIADNKLLKQFTKIKPKTLARSSKEAKAQKLAGKLRSILADILLQDYGEEGDKKFKKQNWWRDYYY